MIRYGQTFLRDGRRLAWVDVGDGASAAGASAAQSRQELPCAHTDLAGAGQRAAGRDSVIKCVVKGRVGFADFVIAGARPLEKGANLLESVAQIGLVLCLLPRLAQQIFK